MYNQTIASAGNTPTKQLLSTVIQYRKDQEGQCYLEENTILYVCRGRWRIEHGATMLEVNTGQLVLLHQHRLIRYRVVQEEALEAPAFLLLTLCGSVVRDFVKQAHLQAVTPPTPGNMVLHEPSVRVSACLQSVEAYFRQGVSMTDALIRLKIQEFLYCLPGSMADQSLLQLILDLRQNYPCNITTVVEENLTNTITLGQLARMSGRSLSSFRRDFLAIYNMPPSRWIRLQRLEKSLQLLASTRMSVTDICYTLGFENIAHFSRLFKSHFGIPPSACRTTANTQPLAATMGEA
ncbi:helix-turn-helix domain-containing protein [Paraflavitalea pollutisoli]|uniref:helix-turn-helix domain-containing protein n=1 Tax=Paraflavitalea pollutisoli TaxID=3034143 RepID=UPI0023EBD732|nr:AraC family transcriptional regulator [Paraflavitalea sp. H1-2-19X]